MNIQILLILAMILLVGYAMYRFKVMPFAMMALAADRDTPSREGKLYSYPVYQTTKIYGGSLVMLNATGYAVPGATATGQIAVGRARDQVDNSAGASGDLNVEIEEGVFRFSNSTAGDEITKAQIGDACYIVDDATVAKTNGTSTRSVAGYIRDVDTDGVWVEFKNTISNDGDLVSTNNLSDVANAGTSRSNIGANKIPITLRATSLVGTTVYGVVSPIAGTITTIHSVLKGGALTTGNATLTGKIGGTAITTGVITITQSGSAIGDKDSCTPSALNVVAVGDEIQFLVGGTNDAAAAFAEISMLITT